MTKDQFLALLHFKPDQSWEVRHSLLKQPNGCYFHVEESDPYLKITVEGETWEDVFDALPFWVKKRGKTNGG